jgi:hypothetical protein
MSERKRSVLTRGEIMFWESAYVIAVVIGMLALVAGSQVKLSLLLVLLLSMAPWTIVWVARTLWKPRPVPRDNDVDTRPDPYGSSDPAVDEMYQFQGSQVWYAFAVGAVLALVATFVYRGDFAEGDGFVQASAIPGLLVVGGVVVVQWAMRRPLLNVRIRPLFCFLGALVLLTLGVILYLYQEVLLPEGQIFASFLVGFGLSVCFLMWLRNV